MAEEHSYAIYPQLKFIPPLLSTQVLLSELYIAMDEGETDPIVRCMSALGMNFTALGGGAAEPHLIATMATIMFDTKYSPRFTHSKSSVKS